MTRVRSRPERKRRTSPLPKRRAIPVRKRRRLIVGVISDTHGLLRPEALAALAGVAVIVHAGDIGAAEVLDRLRATAPVIAVRGNNDRERWAGLCPAKPRRFDFLGSVRIVPINPPAFSRAAQMIGRLSDCT